jgi:hypothetical protein
MSRQPKAGGFFFRKSRDFLFATTSDFFFAEHKRLR